MTTTTTTTTTTSNERNAVASLLYSAREALCAALCAQYGALTHYRAALAARDIDAAVAWAMRHDACVCEARKAAGWVALRSAVLASLPGPDYSALRGARAIVDANRAVRTALAAWRASSEAFGPCRLAYYDAQSARAALLDRPCAGRYTLVY